MVRDVLAHTGVPKEILTDRATNLNSELANGIYNAFGLDKKTTASYNAQGDGAAEAMVKLGKRGLAVLVDAKGGEWDEHVSTLNMSLASMFKEPFKVSPFFAEHGREMVLPSFFEQPLAETDPPTVKDMKLLHARLMTLRDESAAEMKKYYDRGREEADFKTGDKVWIAKHERDNALDAKRIGPFRIDKTLSPLDVKIKEIPQGPPLGRTHDVINVKHVAHYKGKLRSDNKPLYQVASIIEHKFVKLKKGLQSRYHVKWTAGDETWEPLRNLLDETDEVGGNITNSALETYWKSHPDLKQREGY